MEQLFDTEKILSFFNIIFYSLILNLIFLVCNTPFLFFYFFIGIGQIEEYLPMFLFCLLPLAPALSALLYSMRRLIQDKDICPMKEYKKGYKNNWKQSIQIGVIQLVIVFVLETNIRFFKQIPQLSLLAVLFMVLLVVLALMTPFLYLFIVRYDMSVMQIIKASLTITLGKPIYAIANLVIGLFVLILFELVAGTTFLFIGSLYTSLLILSNQKLLKQLENQ